MEGDKKVKLETELFGIKLKSPFIVGSGPLNYNAEGMIRTYEAGAGAVVTKTIRDKAAENPFPHIARNSKDSLVNAEKWADIPGEQWVQEEIPKAKDKGVVVIGSIGHTPNEVDNWVAKVDQAGADMIELVSYQENTMLPMVKKARQLTDKPILVKISPNWSSPVETALKSLELGGDGITAIDSVGPVLRININTQKPLLGSQKGYGWLSGSAIKPITLRYVADIATQTDKPVIGIGGVANAEDAVEMLMAGADLVGICSAPMMRGIDYINKLNNDLDNLLTDLDYNSIQEVSKAALANLYTEEVQEKIKFDFNKDTCIKCNRCIEVCPYSARSFKEDQLLLDEKRCRFCGLCATVCPTDALQIVD